MSMNYATAKNYRGETLMECVNRLRETQGAFAEGYALHCSQYFRSVNDNDMATFYRVVAHFIEAGCK